MTWSHHSARWLVRQPSGMPCRARLICLPYAGGNARVFHDWGKYLIGVEILSVEAPGKGGRLLETPIADLDKYCQSLMIELGPLLTQPVPFSFFGHSNGALLAFELCCRLQAIGAVMPQRLLLSACGAPWARASRDYSTLDDLAFKNMLGEFNATPPEVLSNDALLNLLMPGLRADFALAQNYKSVWPALRGVVTHVLHGVEDTVTEAELSAWQQRIALPVGIERLPGGHFNIHDERDALLEAISRQLKSSR